MAGGAWVALAGALRHWRGVNETISSLLLNYIAIAILNQLVEGPFRDPNSLNRPSSSSIGEAHMIGTMPGTEIHWGLPIGIVVCVLAYVLIGHTTLGFAARVAGGNLRAARMVGLPIGRLVMMTCFLGGGGGRPRRHDRGGGGAGARQRRSRHRLRLRRHPRRLPRAAEPAGARSRSRSCWAGSAPAAGCCSAILACPTRRPSCCRASFSSRSWRATRSTAACRGSGAREAGL